MRRKTFYLLLLATLVLALVRSFMSIQVPDLIFWLILLILVWDVGNELETWHKKMTKIARIIDDNRYKLDLLLDLLHNKKIVTRFEILNKMERRKEVF